MVDLTELLARLLEPVERDAVLGDLAEAGVFGGRALRDIAGLVIRRQVGRWSGWRPWLALIGIAIPAAFLLSLISAQIEFTLQLNLRTWRTLGVRYEDGLTLWQDAVFVVCHLLLLSIWAATSAFAMASLSRGTLWLNGALFYSIWLFGAGWPAAICIAPSVFGLIPRRARMLLVAAALLTLVVIWSEGWQMTALENWSAGALPHASNWRSQLFLFAVMNWPVVYLACRRLSRASHIS